MENQQETTKRTKIRSAAYPVLSLEKAINLSLKLKQSLGEGPYSRAEAAKGVGHDKLTGPAARKVAALVHYGLLDRTGNAYKQSKLAQDILNPITEEKKKRAIVIAVSRPKLFKTLLKRYEGQALPNMLANILIRDDIKEKVAPNVVRIFKDSITFAELYPNGIVGKIPDEEQEKEEQEEANKALQRPLAKTSPRKPVYGTEYHIFNYDNGIKLYVPKTPASSDVIVAGEMGIVDKAIKNFSSKLSEKKEKNKAQNEDVEEDATPQQENS